MENKLISNNINKLVGYLLRQKKKKKIEGEEMVMP